MEASQNTTNQKIKKDSTLYVVAQSIIRGFDSLYENLDKLKKKASNEQQKSQINHIEDKIESLAQKTLNQSQDLRNTTKRVDVEQEIEQLKRQLQYMQRQHEQLAQKHDDLEQRVSDLQCQMVTREEFQHLKGQCQQRFSMFQNRFKVIQQKNQKLYVYMDEDFKRKIKPTQAYQRKLNQLMKTNYRLFEYAKKMYWSLINQILAYRALSTGMVEKGTIPDKRRESLLFREVVNVINSATFLLTGIPFVSSIFLIVKDMSSIFFNKKQDIVQHNMAIRVEGYFTQQDISNDVAQAVLQLISNPNIEARLNQFRTRSMITSALIKFFQFISTFQMSAQLLADLFASKLTKIKKQKNDNDYITENVVTDSSLIIWKMAEFPPAQRRFPVTGAVRALFNRNSPQPPQFYNPNLMQQNMYNNRSSNTSYPGINNMETTAVGQAPQNLNQSGQFVINTQKYGQNGIIQPGSQNNPMTKMQAYENKFSTYSGSTQATQSNVTTQSSNQYGNLVAQNNMVNSQGPIKQTNSVIEGQLNSNKGMTQSGYSAYNYPGYYNQQRPPYFKLKVLRAELTLKKQVFGKMNPYCIIKYKDKLVRTQINKGGDLRPAWSQQFIFQTSEMPSAINIQVFDKERLLKDDLLGNANIMDMQIDPREQEVQLWNQGKPVGKLYILLQP